MDYYSYSYYTTTYLLLIWHNFFKQIMKYYERILKYAEYLNSYYLLDIKIFYLNKK